MSLNTSSKNAWAKHGVEKKMNTPQKKRVPCLTKRTFQHNVNYTFLNQVYPTAIFPPVSHRFVITTQCQGWVDDMMEGGTEKKGESEQQL